MTMQKSRRSENTPVNQGPTTKKHTDEAENATSIRKPRQEIREHKSEKTTKQKMQSENATTNKKTQI